jgi:putative endonuclease
VSRRCHVYIVANRARTLYIGVTGNLARRIQQHKDGRTPGFTSRYGLNRLVYCEEVGSPLSAIAREKQLKGWVRRRKVELIERLNPE